MGVTAAVHSAIAGFGRSQHLGAKVRGVPLQQFFVAAFEGTLQPGAHQPWSTLPRSADHGQQTFGVETRAHNACDRRIQPVRTRRSRRRHGRDAYRGVAHAGLCRSCLSRSRIIMSLSDGSAFSRASETRVV